MKIIDAIRNHKREKISAHFFRDEFKSQFDDIEYPDKYLDRLKKLCKNLEIIRYQFGRPIRITSGYRSPENNKRVGGVKRSQHLQGRAADFVIDGIDPREVALSVRELIHDGWLDQGGVGDYENFTHYDIRGRAARWRG